MGEKNNCENHRPFPSLCLWSFGHVKRARSSSSGWLWIVSDPLLLQRKLKLKTLTYGCAVERVSISRKTPHFKDGGVLLQILHPSWYFLTPFVHKVYGSVRVTRWRQWGLFHSARSANLASEPSFPLWFFFSIFHHHFSVNVLVLTNFKCGDF